MDGSLRIIIFLLVFAIFAGLEAAQPRRREPAARGRRWIGAFGLMVIGSAVGRLIISSGLAGVALWAETKGYGLFNALSVPAWIAMAASFILLDLAVWAQHVALHRVRWLWRLHRVHHSDTGFDVSTAVRFHPVEIAVSTVWKAAVVVALGAPVLVAFWFEVALSAFALFNHSNWRLPPWADTALRPFVVTPDMHRVHHSADKLESQRNFGFCLSIWDRLFALYQPQPAAGHAGMTIGQPGWRGERDTRLDRLLIQPIAADPAD